MEDNKELDRICHEYWEYYLMLEDMFLDSLQCVALYENNFKTFSINYAHLLVDIGTELDMILGEIYYLTAPDCLDPKDIKTEPNIKNYAECIDHAIPNIYNIAVRLQNYDITCSPFEMLDKEKPRQTLPWWDAFDNMKHSRRMYFNQATQENVLNMLSALYIIENIYLGEIVGRELKSKPMYENFSKLFQPKLEIQKVNEQKQEKLVALREFQEKLLAKLDHYITEKVFGLVEEDPELKNLYEKVLGQTNKDKFNRKTIKFVKRALIWETRFLK